MLFRTKWWIKFSSVQSILKKYSTDHPKNSNYISRLKWAGVGAIIIALINFSIFIIDLIKVL